VSVTYRVVVLELDDVVPRIRADRPNLYVGISSRCPEALASGLSEGRFRPAWARSHVVTTRAELAPDVTGPRDAIVKHRDETIRQLRAKGFTVNRIERAYRLYVINLVNPARTDIGKGYVYVGQTSKTPELRLAEHLSEAVGTKGNRLASRVVTRFGQDLNHGLMPQKIYLNRKQAMKAERRLADRLRADGYTVEGGH